MFRLIGRALIAIAFLSTGFSQLFHFESAVSLLAARGVPLAALCQSAGIAIQLLGGTALVLGVGVRPAALFLAAYLLAASLVFHLSGAQRIVLLKNAAIIGSLFMVAVHGAGKYRLS
ncbi:MAG: DoxX family protein [Elusimicrobia bacterium]|nr:DoxX family protein [Elusimicrobiota bacterium]